MSIIPYDSNGSVLKQIAQWDTGVTVTVSDDSITDDCVLQFGSKGGRLAYQVGTTVDGTTLTGTIPGVVAAQPKTVVGYVVEATDDANRTIGTFEIRVIPRVRPSDLVYSFDDERISLKGIKDMVDDLTNGLISDDILSEAVNNWLEANGLDLDLDEEAVQALIDASLTTYATQAYVAEQITTALTDGTIDLSIYSTTSEVQALIDAAVADVTVDLSDYSTTSEVQEMIDAAIATVDGSEAATYAAAAAASAEAAAESAASAATSESSAASSASAASTSEANAAASETAAAASATEAASSATEAASAVASVSETVEAALTAAKESGEFDGADGADGATGADGKSAYETAVEGGYTGTEEEFASALASMATLLNGEEVEW